MGDERRRREREGKLLRKFIEFAQVGNLIWWSLIVRIGIEAIAKQKASISNHFPLHCVGKRGRASERETGSREDGVSLIDAARPEQVITRPIARNARTNERRPAQPAIY